MAINLPSRTEATMPHPHEQKLHEVVNSLILESFSSCVLARNVGISTRLANPRLAHPPAAFRNHSRRETLDPFRGPSALSVRISSSNSLLWLLSASMAVS